MLQHNSRGDLQAESIVFDKTQTFRIRRLTAQTIGTSSDTPILFSTGNADEQWDGAAMHSLVTNPSEAIWNAIEPSNANFLFIGALSWVASTTGSRQIKIRKNGGTNIGHRDQRANQTAINPTRQTMAYALQMTNTDYLELCAFQDTGGNLDIQGGNVFLAAFILLP